MNFDSRHVLLTGAAGGLGRQMTLDFLGAGAGLLAIDHDAGRGARLVEEANALAPDRFMFKQLDLRDAGALAQAIDDYTAAQAPIDTVINNAAIYPAMRFEDYSLQDYRAIQEVNVEAAIRIVQQLLPGMRSRRFGRIINIASITFYGGWPNLYPYVASKAALVGLTRAWAREFGPDDVTVNAVSVGAIPTDAEKIHPDPVAYNQFVLDHQSLKRRGTPRDIAHVVMYLASEYAGFITGQLLNADGGWVMH